MGAVTGHDLTARDLRAERRARSRAAILDAATDLLGDRGLHEWSLRDLAAAVGMRAPSLYGYFDGKAAIYDALFERGYRGLGARLAAIDWPDDRTAALTLGLRDFLAFCREDWTRYQLLFTRAVPGWEPTPTAYAASQDQYAAMGRVFAAHGIDDPDDLDLWTALCSGLAAQQFANDPQGERYDRFVEPVVAMYEMHLERTRR